MSCVCRRQVTHGLAPASADRSSGNGGVYGQGTAERSVVKGSAKWTLRCTE